MRAFVVDELRSKALRALNYAPELEKIRKAGSASAVPLGSLLSRLGDSYWSVFTRHDCSPEFGVELLTQSDMFAAEPSGRVIRRDSMPKPDLHRVQRWQVLVAGAGQMGEGNLFGQSIIADGRLTHGYLGPHAVAMTFDEPGGLHNLWTYAYLNTSAGMAAIKTAAFGTSIPGLRVDLLNDVPVPIASTAMMERVARLVRTAVEQRELFATAMREMRLCVQTQLLPNEMADATRSRTRVYVTWPGPFATLRAWNFASAGSLLRTTAARWGTTIRDWIEPDGVFMGARVARAPCSAPFGVELLSQRDVCSIRPIPRRIVATVPSLAVEPDWLLVASRGQTTEGALFGRVERAVHMPRRCAISGDVMRFVPRQGLGPALFAFLASPAGVRLLQSTAYGTSIPAMREDLLLSLPAPPPTGEWAQVATEQVALVTSSRTAASAAEAEAIRIIEQEVLPQWLA